MKQHITKDQLKELTEEQKAHLRIWWSKRRITNTEQRMTLHVQIENDPHLYPLLSIGQMIEYLLENTIPIPSATINLCDTLWQLLRDNL